MINDIKNKLAKYIDLSDELKEVSLGIYADIEKNGFLEILENFEQLNEYIPKIRENMKEMVALIPKQLDLVENTGYDKVISNIGKLKEVIQLGQEVAPEIIPLIPRIREMSNKAMDALIEGNDEIKEELEDMDDVNIVVLIEDLNQGMTLQVVNHKIEINAGTVENADLTVRMPVAALAKLSSGDTSDVLSAYMAGDFTVEGDLTKAMAFRGIMEFLVDEIGIGS